MSEPFLGQISMFGFNFAPRGFALCNGQILPINQNQALYSLLGTTYGGDGRTTFGIPELRGRAPLHTGSDYNLGQKGGVETVALTAAQIPQHTHTLQAVDGAADSAAPTGGLTSKVATALYQTPGSVVPLASNSVGTTGGSQAHNNRQPYLAITFVIAVTGLFPSRN